MQLLDRLWRQLVELTNYTSVALLVIIVTSAAWHAIDFIPAQIFFVLAGTILSLTIISIHLGNTSIRLSRFFENNQDSVMLRLTSAPVAFGYCYSVGYIFANHAVPTVL